MERAIRVSSAEKGFDPRDITLVAFGGAGPMHAAALARTVGIPTVLVPEQPGVFSALGLVMSDIRHDFVQTRPARGDEIAATNLQPVFAELEAEGRDALVRDGIAEERRVLRRSADMRYHGQAYEVNVPIPDGPLDDGAVSEMIARFHDLHMQLYAHNHPDKIVEFVSARIAAIGQMGAPPVRSRANGKQKAEAREHRPVYFEETGGFADVGVYERSDLGPGCAFAGPAIVEQIDSTIVIHPEQRVSVDPFGNLLIAVGG